MTEPADLALRILVGAESAADAAGAIRLAKIIKGQGAAVFGGLLALQDSDRYVQSKAQRIVAVSGQLIVSPDAERMQILADSELRAFRHLLSRMAASVGALWSAEAKRGALAEHLAEEARGWDITIIGHRLLNRRRGSVVVLSSAGKKPRAVRRMAEQVAAGLGTVVDELRPDVADRGALEGLYDQINRLNAAAVVLDEEIAAIAGLERIAELLTLARCPVVILRNSAVLQRMQDPVRADKAAAGQ